MIKSNNKYGYDTLNTLNTCLTIVNLSALTIGVWLTTVNCQILFINILARSCGYIIIQYTTKMEFTLFGL
jgi:hypothetical protein